MHVLHQHRQFVNFSSIHARSILRISQFQWSLGRRKRVIDGDKWRGKVEAGRVIKRLILAEKSWMLEKFGNWEIEK